MGSYLCQIRSEGRPDVAYPVHIGRGEHWHGIAPGETEARPTWLPAQTDLGPSDCYIPPGWFIAGGDPEAVDSLPRQRNWAEGLIFKRSSITNREFIAFLDDLVCQGREEEALRHVPRERAGKEGEVGAMVYGRRDDGSFELVVDVDGDAWHLDWPVMMVDWLGAQAFSEWFAAQTGQPWRLPGELEWEKAARGVDGRFFPWGDTLDPSWCCMRDSHPDRMLPAVIDSFPVDTSPFGLRGMGGNMRDWCADLFSKEGPATPGDQVQAPVLGDVTCGVFRVVRGGAWGNLARDSRCAHRSRHGPWHRHPHNGFRVARPAPADSAD